MSKDHQVRLTDKPYRDKRCKCGTIIPVSQTQCYNCRGEIPGETSYCDVCEKEVEATEEINGVYLCKECGKKLEKIE